jgi:hypothetical protein
MILDTGILKKKKKSQDTVLITSGPDGFLYKILHAAVELTLFERKHGMVCMLVLFPVSVCPAARVTQAAQTTIGLYTYSTYCVGSLHTYYSQSLA